MKDLYVFPAIFSFDKDGISVHFPDLDGALTCGESFEEALINAKECMGLHLYGMEVDNEPIPEPTFPMNIKLESNQLIALVEVMMNFYRSELDNKAVKVTTTIPAWLKRIADQRKFNYSNALQVSIIERYGLKHHTK